MNNFSNYAETSILNHSLRAINYIKPSSYWYALFKENPGENGDLSTELSTGGYERVEIINDKKNFPQCAPSGAPTKTNGEDILFPVATSSQGTAKFWGLFNGPRSLASFSATTASGSSVITVASTAALRVGMSISGSNIPSNAVILQIISLTQFKICTATPLLNIESPVGTFTPQVLGARTEDYCTSTGATTVTVSPKLIIYSPLDHPISIYSSKIAKIPEKTLSITIPQSPKGGMTRYSESKFLDLFFGHLPYPAPFKVYTGFGTALVIAGENNDQITEVDNETYSRQETVFGAPSDGVCRNIGSPQHSAGITGATGTVIFSINSMGIWDDDDAGRLIWAGFTSKTVGVKGTDVLYLKNAGLPVQMQ